MLTPGQMCCNKSSNRSIYHQQSLVVNLCSDRVNANAKAKFFMLLLPFLLGVTRP